MAQKKPTSSDDELYMAAVARKLLEWEKVATVSPDTTVINSGVDLTVGPDVVRATFPGLTPFRLLYAQDILKDLVRVPSIPATSVVSFLFGVVFTVSQFRLAAHSRHLSAAGIVGGGKSPSASTLTVASRAVGGAVRLLIRSTVGVIMMLLFYRFVRKRDASVASVSNFMNVSSLPGGPCHIVNKVLTISNSHAGTHADTPLHFTHDIVPSFSNAHYVGRAVVVDLSPLLFPELMQHSDSEEQIQEMPALPRRAITSDILLQTLQPLLGMGMLESGSMANPNIWRLLFVTRRLLRKPNDSTGPQHPEAARDDESVWSNDFAFFEPNAIRFLNAHFPNLLLIGTDAPSVDHPSAAPICCFSHGELYRSGVAILENLQFKELYCVLEQNPLLHGSLLTVFSQTQAFEDSRGCSALFFPAEFEH